MTLKEFETTIKGALESIENEIQQAQDYAEQNEVEEDCAYEEGYSGALQYVLKLLQEVK